MADTWFERRTYAAEQFDLDTMLAAKEDTRISLVIPARDEAATIGEVVAGVHAAFAGTLLDEIVVIDGQSTDDTAALARNAGATVHRLADIRPDLGARVGKGEAIWKSHFVTTGDVLVFMDADLTQWHTGFVTGLLGPLLTDPDVALVKGFYERPFTDGGVEVRHGGGRVTELVARPLLALEFPELADVVQPLAGEWAIRRSAHERMSVPAGYGVDLAALIDTAATLGLDAVAQVDLGRRAHSHQPVAALGAMAAQLMATVRVRATGASADAVELHQFVPGDGGFSPVVRAVDLTERPPARTVRLGTGA